MSILGVYSWSENSEYAKALLRAYRSLQSDMAGAGDKIPAKVLAGWRITRNDFAKWLSTKSLTTKPTVAFDYDLFGDSHDVLDMYARHLAGFRKLYTHYSGNAPTMSDEETPKPPPPLMEKYDWILPVVGVVAGVLVLREAKGLFGKD